jgi:hypothetical protein
VFPFLLDEVARLPYVDMLRDFEARQQVNDIARNPTTCRIWRRIRFNTGQFFIAIGSCLVDPDAVASTLLQGQTT